MSTRRKRRQSQQSNSSSPLKSNGLLISLGILVSVVLVVFIFMNSRSSQPTDSEVTATNVASPQPTPSPLTALPVGEGNIEQRVIGRWLRTDGDYFIEITELHDDGKLDAGYYNPHPINVVDAKVLPDADVFLKLQDENYPGSTYTLNYEAENDTLLGIYFHAGLQQEFEVVFERFERNE